MNNLKTSTTDPLRIDSVTLASGGKIGMTICPGKKQFYALTGNWDRNLAADLAVIKDWGAAALVSLIKDHEFEQVGVTELPDKATRLGIQWYHLPIQDVSIPSSVFEELWPTIGAGLRELLMAGERIVIHCMGGLGRTGLVAARLLIELGMDNETAIRSVRKARCGAIETWEQEQYVRKLPRV